MTDADATRWVGTWATAPAPIDGLTLSNQTVRMNARVSLGGHRLRVRLSNAYGMRKMEVGAAHVALRGGGASTVPGSDRTLTFNGKSSASIPSGALLVSDVVELEVAALADLTISVYLPGDLPADFQITGHGNARQTNYISSAGDFTAAASWMDPQETQSFLFVSGVEVEAPAGAGGIVAFG